MKIPLRKVKPQIIVIWFQNWEVPVLIPHVQGALEAVWAAATAHATGSAEFLQEIRRAFPVVDR